MDVLGAWAKCRIAGGCAGVVRPVVSGKPIGAVAADPVDVGNGRENGEVER